MGECLGKQRPQALSAKDLRTLPEGIGEGNMESRKNDRLSIWMNVSSMLIFGTIGIFRRYLPLSSAFLACSRGIIGGLFLFAFMRLKKGRTREKLSARTAMQLAFTGALMGINWMLLFEAYNFTTVSVATLCYYMQPTIVMLLSPLLFRERLTGRKAVCAGIAIIGMVLVSGVTGGEEARPGMLRGIILGLGAAIFYASVVIMNKRIAGVEAYQKTTIQLLSAGAVMIPYLLLMGASGDREFSARTLILLFVVCVVHTGIAYVLYFGSIDGLKAQSVAIFSYIDPVAALLFSALFLKEPLSLPGMIGAVLIIGSAVASEVSWRS